MKIILTPGYTSRAVAQVMVEVEPDTEQAQQQARDYLAALPSEPHDVPRRYTYAWDRS